MGVTAIGVDVGQKHDPTTICVVEPQDRTVDGEEEQHFLIRHLERLPLGTRYQDVAGRLAFVIRQVDLQAGSTPRIFIDATGVGQPVIDLLREANFACRNLVPVYFTHGDQRRENRDDIKLGKAFLVSRLQVLLETRRIHAPRNSETEALVDELLNYEIRTSENARDQYGAFRPGTHDDLVTALGLAVQIDYNLNVEENVFCF